MLKNSLPPDDINKVWVSDITYVRILRGFVYVAIIMDLCSKRVIGWAISRNIDRRLTLGSIEDGGGKQTTKTRLYSSFGQRGSIRLQGLCEFFKRKGFKISMSRKGNPYDNAAMESFMKTLKYNEVVFKEL